MGQEIWVTYLKFGLQVPLDGHGSLAYGGSKLLDEGILTRPLRARDPIFQPSRAVPTDTTLSEILPVIHGGSIYISGVSFSNPWGISAVTTTNPKHPVNPVGIHLITTPPRLRRVKFRSCTPGCDRIHHVSQGDLMMVLLRLPAETWERLRGIHFNDQSRGGRVLGYTTTRGRREIALCALPPRMSLTRSLIRGQTCEEFGARRGAQWPEVAIRRFLIYDVFLHELGHLQIVDPQASSARRVFAGETRAEDFATYWRRRLWSEEFAFPDPAHQAPSDKELARHP
jgi:hypothetical protein